MGTSARVNATFEEVKEPEVVPRWCRPRTMPVNMPAPLGPNLFILGEPVLHRYYTIFDWDGPRIGMSVANTPRNLVDRSKITERIGELPKDVDVYLMQHSVNSSSGHERSKGGRYAAKLNEDDEGDGFVAVQVVMEVSMRFTQF